MRYHGSRKLLQKFIHTALSLIKVTNEGKCALSVFCSTPHEMLVGCRTNANGEEPGITQTCCNFLKELRLIRHATIRNENHLAKTCAVLLTIKCQLDSGKHLRATLRFKNIYVSLSDQQTPFIRWHGPFEQS